jgi:hypothetical protein
MLSPPPRIFLQVAGLVASVVTTPMDVVKTRVMTQDLTQGAVKIGVRQTVRSILKHEGPLAFTYGMLPRVMLKVGVFSLLVCEFCLSCRRIKFEGFGGSMTCLSSCKVALVPMWRFVKMLTVRRTAPRKHFTALCLLLLVQSTIQRDSCWE